LSAVKSEEELIGTFIKLRKTESELHQKIEALTGYGGPINKALEKKYSDNMNDPERLFNAEMSVNPDRIMALAQELKNLQKEYALAHNAKREFEGKYPEIAKTFGGSSYY
jgi:hypothetical protein